MELKFRALRADEIDVRVGQVAQDKSSVTLLLYKDARCDQNILDETVGPMNWQRKHSRDNANCTVEIWDEDKNQWIGKEDTGTESNTEAEKGLASDSFKRACVNWGIGRELYDAPRIKVKLNPQDKDQDPKYVKFWVKDKQGDNRHITGLTICWMNRWGDKTDEVAFQFPRGKAPAKAAPAKKAEAKAAPAEDPALTPMRERVKSIYRGDVLVELLNKYNVLTVADLTKEQLETILTRYDEFQAKKKGARTA